jgi:hypothetical protein
MVLVLEFSMAVTQISVNALPASGVGRIAGVRHCESLQDSKLRFDQVDPGSFRGSPHRVDAQAAQQGQEARVVLDIVQVAQNHEQPLVGIAPPEPAESFGDFSDSLPVAECPV